MQLDEYIVSVASVPLSELYHHGVEGQKWGQRNGPPYPLKESAKSSAEKSAASGGSSVSGNGTDSSNAKTKTQKVETKKESKTQTDDGEKAKGNKTSTKKKASQLSDEELKTAVNRLELEKKYKDLKSSQSEVKSVGKNVVKSVSQSTLTNVGTQLGVYGLATLANKIISYISNEDIYYEYVNPKKGQKDK